MTLGKELRAEADAFKKNQEENAKKQKEKEIAEAKEIALAYFNKLVYSAKENAKKGLYQSDLINIPNDWIYRNGFNYEEIDQTCLAASELLKLIADNGFNYYLFPLESGPVKYSLKIGF